ncbi:hypothetical protein F4680DRAFT_327924 [Xylaria scruposa]|nr:hypothetical protein F4680DRAFT_327924 [Xylaria scruposa]
MFSIPVINKRMDAGLVPQPNFQEFRLRLNKGRKNLLLDLPPELRNIIYKLVVGKGCEPTRHIPVTLWRTPSLAQVNRQLRNEVIPVYYGRDGGFKLLLKYPGDHSLFQVHLFCALYSQYLQYVRYLDINVQYKHQYKHERCLLSGARLSLFLIFSESCVAGGKTEYRIGNDETNWDDNIHAGEAFEATIRRNGVASQLYPAFGGSPLFYYDLHLLAKHAKLANRWIQLSHENHPMLIVESYLDEDRLSRQVCVVCGVTHGM